MSGSGSGITPKVHADDLKDLFENVPDIYIEDDGIIQYCPAVRNGQSANPVCRRKAISRRDYPDKATCKSKEPNMEKRIHLPKKEVMQDTFKENKHVKIDDQSTILFDHSSAEKERRAAYGQAIE